MPGKSNWTKRKEECRRITIFRGIDLEQGINKYLGRRSKPFKDISAHKSTSTPPTEQQLLNKLEKVRRSKMPVTLPSFKCLDTE